MDIWFFVIPFTIAAALPGPAQGALVARVLARGGRASLPFAAGMVAGNAIWLLAALFGLSALALRFEPVFVAVKWGGVAYLLILSWQLWTAPAAAPGGDARKVRRGGVLPGLLLTLGNPKAVVFFGAVLPHAFDMTALTTAEIAAVALLGAALDLGVQLAYVAAATRARALVRSPRRMRAVNRSAAGLMAGSAALIATRG